MTSVKICVEEVGFYWKVMYENSSGLIRCPSFATNRGHKWDLLLGSYERASYFNVEVSCCMGKETTPYDSLFRAKCCCTILGNDGKILQTFSILMKELEGSVFKSSNNSPLNMDLFNKKFYPEKTPRAYVVKVRIYWENQDYMMLISSGSSLLTKRMLDAYQELFESGKLSDVVLRVQDREIKAHKIVLYAYSDVFRAMFLSEMLESHSGCVQIKGFDERTIKALLEYMYFTIVKFNCSEEAQELYRCADQYGVAGLKDICKGYLFANLAEDNAMDVLLLADLYKDLDLRHVACSFICKHPESATSTKNSFVFE